nr:hypothetical protein [Frateuria terrea]
MRSSLTAIEEAGFARRQMMKGKGQAWRWTMWTLLLPEGAERLSLPKRKGEEADSAPLGEGMESDDTKVRNVVPKGEERRSTDFDHRDFDHIDQESSASALTPSKGKGKQERLTFKQWAESIVEGEALIPADHPEAIAIRTYADRVQLPTEFLGLAWEWFSRKYEESPKTYANWPRHLRNAVEGAWGGLWRINHEGRYVLTTAGEQLKRDLESA